MQPLTDPKHGGDINKLREFLRVDDDGWRLVVGFLIACFRPGLPFPVLQLHGEHGSTKSTAAKVIRKLVDPNKSLLRKPPKTDDDLLISASKSWVVTFENVSHIEQSLSDAICRLATGGGLSKRMLYTDDDEVILDVLRPVIITSIEEVATRPDLLDRALLVELGTIDEADRLPEDEFWASFDVVRGEILGAVLDAVSGAIREIGTVRLERLPRMADFAKWVTAAEPALRWGRGSFLSTYTENRGRSDEIAVDSATIGRLLCEIADEGFEGSMTELLELLNTRADDKVQRSRSWPKNARALSGQVKRLSPNLRKLGYDVEHCADTAAGSRNRAYRLSRREK